MLSFDRVRSDSDSIFESVAKSDSGSVAESDSKSAGKPASVADSDSDPGPMPSLDRVRFQVHGRVRGSGGPRL